ncbi:hypothetical protein [Komagataeibacter europaeus]|nr:hypothetical protein [Komagataeibacter europaeus]
MADIATGRRVVDIIARAGRTHAAFRHEPAPMGSPAPHAHGRAP